jgi:hypothetical protein
LFREGELQGVVVRMKMNDDEDDGNNTNPTISMITYVKSLSRGLKCTGSQAQVPICELYIVDGSMFRGEAAKMVVAMERKVDHMSIHKQQ